MPSTSKPGDSPPDRRVPPKPTRTIPLAHSPDADDAFMFWALAAGKIDTGGRRHAHEPGDIESFNPRALQGELEVTAGAPPPHAFPPGRHPPPPPRGGVRGRLRPPRPG